eukprot:scaffold12462_cov109-Isochrysis_galbana.AAC.3
MDGHDFVEMVFNPAAHRCFRMEHAVMPEGTDGRVAIEHLENSVVVRRQAVERSDLIRLAIHQFHPRAQAAVLVLTGLPATRREWMRERRREVSSRVVCRTDDRRGCFEIEVVVWTGRRVRHSFRSELRRRLGPSRRDLLDA